MDVTFTNIHREGNSVADCLAKESLIQRSSRVFDIGDSSLHLKKLIYSDNTSVPYLRIPK